MGNRAAAIGISWAVIVTVSLGAQAPSAPSTAAPPTVSRLGGFIRANPPSGPVPRLADGKPDLRGAWLGGWVGDISRSLAKGETITLLPGVKMLPRISGSGDDPITNCIAQAPPRARGGYPWRIVMEPPMAFFIWEVLHDWRQVFMDGRPHPPDLDPTWYGHSIGRWDGDTLVVDTVGFNDKVWLSNTGYPSTDKLHTIERHTRTDLGTLEIEITVDDPGAYAKPFKVASTARLMPNEELMEYICNENNQDIPLLIQIGR